MFEGTEGDELTSVDACLDNNTGSQILVVIYCIQGCHLARDLCFHIRPVYDASVRSNKG